MPDPRAAALQKATGIGPASMRDAIWNHLQLGEEGAPTNEPEGMRAATLTEQLRDKVRDLYASVAEQPLVRLADALGVSDIAGVAKGFDEPHDVGKAMGLPLPGGEGKLTGAAARKAEQEALRESLLGVTKATRPQAIASRTMRKGGSSFHLPTGAEPEPGSFMVGKYANTSPRNTIADLAAGETFGPNAIRAHVGKNVDQLTKPETYYGSWRSQKPEEGVDKVYQDVVQRFSPTRVTKKGETVPDPDALRKATKFGERTKQEALYQIGDTPETGKELPVGDWNAHVAGPEMRAQMDEMADLGKHLMGEDDWWKLKGTSFERVYGIPDDPAKHEFRMRQLAGFLASTSPQNPPMRNIQDASEYMRRVIANEHIIQPDFRIPTTAMDRNKGTSKIFGEGKANKNNLVRAYEGRLGDLQENKVREMGGALMDDPNAVVLDRQHAKLSEDPARGIYAGTVPNVVPKGKPYEHFKAAMSQAATERGLTPRIYSAHVWEGIRDTIRRTGELFGTKYRASAIPPESEAFFRSFDRLITQKAQHLGITVSEMEKRLASGDAELLSTLIATGIGAEAYRRSQMDTPAPPSAPSLRDQTLGALQ